MISLWKVKTSQQFQGWYPIRFLQARPLSVLQHHYFEVHITSRGRDSYQQVLYDKPQGIIDTCVLLMFVKYWCILIAVIVRDRYNQDYQVFGNFVGINTVWWFQKLNLIWKSSIKEVSLRICYKISRILLQNSKKIHAISCFIWFNLPHFNIT